MISKELLKQIIVSNEDFILKQVKHIIGRERVFLPESLNKAVIFYGVRRSGKTFLLYDLFKKKQGRSLYIDFEDERLSGFDLKDLQSLKDAFLELKPQLVGQELVFLLDELQNITGWEKFCRRAVEREQINVFVSGSSSKVMPAEIHTELRGRAWSIELLPFSFKEYLQAKGLRTIEQNLIYGPSKVHIKNHFRDYLRWGGFPEVCLVESEWEKTKLLKEYLGAMFFRDLIERYHISNHSLLESLSDRLFSAFSTKFSLTPFYKQYKDRFPFSKDLLFIYYKYFLQSMLVFEVRTFSESTYKRMRNPAKIYLVDAGLGRRVTSADSGRLLENMIYLELKRRGYEVFYYEGKKECDFIAKTEDGHFLPIQVCFELTEENREREINGLVEACQYLQVKEGILLSLDNEEEINKDHIGINVIPAWKWVI
jgi:uncharacterized protein